MEPKLVKTDQEIFQEEKFMDYPLVKISGIIYIACDKYSSAIATQELWNIRTTGYFARFPQQLFVHSSVHKSLDFYMELTYKGLVRGL